MNKKASILKKAIHSRSICNKLRNNASIEKTAATPFQIGKSAWDWWLRLGTAKNGIVNGYKAVKPHPNNNNWMQRTTDGINAALQTGLGIGGIIGKIPPGVVGTGGVGWVSGLGYIQGALNDAYGDKPRVERELTDERLNKARMTCIDKFCKDTGKNPTQLTPEDLNKIDINAYQEAENMTKGLRGVYNGTIDTAKAYGKTLNNVGENATGPALYNSLKFMYNMNPYRWFTGTTTWAKDKKYKEFEKAVHDREYMNRYGYPPGYTPPLPSDAWHLGFGR